MRKSRYSDNQILGILKQNEAGVSVADLCREHGMGSAQFYKWRSKFGGMDTSLMKRMKALGGSNILPAIVGIVAVLGSAERYRRDRAARLLMEKRLNEHNNEKPPQATD